MVGRWGALGAKVVAWSREALDVTDGMAVDGAVADARPDVVVHAAAYTSVDQAEAEPRVAYRVNCEGTAHVAQACARHGAMMVHVSTDMVFDEGHAGPIAPEAPVSPVNAYGRSKAAGEEAVRAAGGKWLIARTMWLYGPGHRNFVDTMREAALKRAAVDVAENQVGAPTPAALVSDVLWHLVTGGDAGVWHVASSGHGSRHQVARVVYDAAGASPDLVRIRSGNAEGEAPRARYSVLDCGRTTLRVGPLPAWDSLVRDYVRHGTVRGLEAAGAA